MAEKFYQNVEVGPNLTNMTFKIRSYLLPITPTITDVTKGWKVDLKKEHNKVCIYKAPI